MGHRTSRGWEIVADYVEPRASATDDRRLEFQRMIDASTTRPPAFDVILVHRFSRFLRDQFQIEFYVRRPRQGRRQSAARCKGRVSDAEIDLISSGY
jgi:Resolvase, N terminal domain